MVLPHYMNLGMFAEQQAVWAEYPAAIKAHLHIVVVDDCSPKGARLSAKHVRETGVASLRLYRLTKKKRWNWLACRNLGATQAATDWLLLTDIDHVVPAQTLQRVIAGELESRAVYRFKRVTAPSVWPYDVAAAAPWKTHNDSWLLTRAMFFDPAVYGYDERLSGCYGTSGEFKDRLFAAMSAHVVLDEALVRYPREVIADASTPPEVYTRKNDPLNDADLTARKVARALVKGWKPLHGLIPHEVVYDSTAVPA